MDRRYYIAYGSNLNLSQMRLRCPTARAVGTATLKDYQLLFKGSQSGSYLTVEPKQGASVPVAVWSVTPEDELRLDRYEGCPSFYYKKDMDLRMTSIKSGKVLKRRAFIYIMHEDRPFGVPDSRYLWTCMDGYDDFGFGRRPLMQAYFVSKEATVHEA